MKEILLFLTLIISIFIANQISLKKLYLFFLKTFKSEKTAKIIITILFFPGTIIHELSHFLTAIILFQKIHSFEILPSFEKNQLILGSVRYYKTDFLRGIIIGIAPFFVGLLSLYCLNYFNIFPAGNIGLNIFFGYLVFVISSTMFSSKKDLVDLIYIIPLILIILFAFYIFNLRLEINPKIIEEIVFNISQFLKPINLYLLLSLIINLFVILIFF
ncbi:MAG: hypothetical protein NZM02_02545 [Patescibacteria group bacterium]|nr:hypothetical protein [Patescibacteria group bacterium]